MSDPRWIVVRHLPQSGDTEQECAIVSAPDAATAAEYGTEMLMQEHPVEGGDHTEEAVAVWRVEGQQWFRFGLRAERCELQCCGGISTEPGKHSAYCEHHRADQA